MLLLFRLKHFTPFIVIVLLNAFVDLGHKIVVQNTIFKIYDDQLQIILTAIVNGLILLPFILLFTPAGFLADRHPKPKVMRLSAMAAIGLSLLITLCYYQGWFEAAFAMTFLLAVQSAFYSPAKYGYIKELVGSSELPAANAIVQAATIIAILLGIFLFSVLFEGQLSGVSYHNEAELLQAIAPLGWLLVLCSLIEYQLTRRLPDLTGGNPASRFQWRRYRRGQYLKLNLASLYRQRTVWLSIIGLSLFWGIAQVVLAAFPSFAKELLNEQNSVVVQGLLACSGVGIILGSLLAGRASKHYIETGLIPLAAAGIVAALALLPNLRQPTLIALDFLLLGTAGGLFIVPLNALIQYHARADRLATVLAGNNWLQNLTMLGFLGITLLFALSGIDSRQLFYLLAGVALLGTLYTIKQLPQSLVRYLLLQIFSSRYRITVRGFENLPAEGAVLLLGNHISWLDWAFMQIASPRPLRFVMHRDYYQRWYLTWVVQFFGAIPISAGQSQSALQQVNAQLKAGEVVCLFPEGAISQSGQLGEFKRGYERTVSEVDGVIIPFYLHGLWGSRFSHASQRLQQIRSHDRRREVIVAFGQPLPLETQADALKEAVRQLSLSTWNESLQNAEPISSAFIRRSKQQGGNTALVDNALNSRLSGYRLLTAVLAFSRLIAKRTPERNVGLLLPTGNGGLIANMAALLRGKTVVNLNYTAPLAALQSAIEQAEIDSLYTSKRFITKLAQRGIDLQPLLSQVTVYDLEELKTEIGLGRQLLLLLASRLLPSRWLYSLFGKPHAEDQPAAIIFSSGSEGAPKGVMLSQRGLLANIRQVSDLLDPQADEKMMATLPLFHAFGLTVTCLLPLLEGIPVVTHPDPTDVLKISRAILRERATLLFATSTFLRLFNRNRRIHPLMLDSLRLVVAGAEKLQTSVREEFKLKFGKEIYEGYGATETGPVACVNLPDRLNRSGQLQSGGRTGSVGLPLPGSTIRIVDPESLQPLANGEAGLILIAGPQLMIGYLHDPQRTEASLVERDGIRWYKSGDKGCIDSDGFVTILDRYSRFAKIGGEMVSLSALESAISQTLPAEVELLSCAVADGKKGERVVLLVAGEQNLESVERAIAAAKLPPLLQPSRLIPVTAIPKLGSGKSDFAEAQRIAVEE